jgi:glycine/serine hydroxymethyltransferase
MPHAHIVTTTTHKTLCGPRGGIVLCHPELAEHVDQGCPMVLGGPLPHVMAARDHHESCATMGRWSIEMLALWFGTWTAH